MQFVSSAVVQHNNNVNSNNNNNATSDNVIKAYKQRWVVLASVAVLQISSSLSRIAFGPVAYTASAFYETEVNVIFYSSCYARLSVMLFLVVTF